MMPLHCPETNTSCKEMMLTVHHMAGVYISQKELRALMTEFDPEVTPEAYTMRTLL